MSQFGADIFDDDSKPPVEPPTSGEPPKKRPRKPTRKKSPAAATEGEEAPTAPPVATPPIAETERPGTPRPETPPAVEPEARGQKKGRRRGASKRSEPIAEQPAAGESTPPERVHDDLGDVLFPSRRRASGALPQPPVESAPETPSARAAEPPPRTEPGAPFEAGEHEGGPPRTRFDDDDDRRGRRRGRRGRRGARDGDDPSAARGTNPPAEPETLHANAPGARTHRGDVAHPAADEGDAGEGGSTRPDETDEVPASAPAQDPFARRRDEPRHGHDRHRGHPRRDQGPRHGQAPRGPHARDDRREPRRDEWRRDRHADDAGDDLGPPAGLPRRDLATARRAPALPVPAEPRRAVALVDVAALMQEARDCGGELSFRRLRKALLGNDELVLGLAFVTPDVPPSGRGALLASGFALRECADAAAAASALTAALAELPTDAERIVLAGAGTGTDGANGASAQRAGFRTVADLDRGDLLLGAECMFVP